MRFAAALLAELLADGVRLGAGEQGRALALTRGPLRVHGRSLLGFHHVGLDVVAVVPGQLTRPLAELFGPGVDPSSGSAGGVLRMKAITR
jgi:hypothetical protein